MEVSDDLPFDAVVPLAEVEVECFTHCVAEEVVAYDGHLALSDGRVLLGDAEGGFELRLIPGRWRIQVALDSPQFSDRVRLWLSAAP